MTASKFQRKLCKVRGCTTPWRSAKHQLCYKHRDTGLPVGPLPRCCTVAGCLNPVVLRGRCHDHQYQDYLQLAPEVLLQIEKGLMLKISPTASGCWEADEDCRGAGGYGKFRPDGRWAYTHRWMYMHLVGPIPNAYELNHECNNPCCARPGHLTPMTKAEHAQVTAARAKFGRMFPGMTILGPDRSHSDRERMFAQMYALPYATGGLETETMLEFLERQLQPATVGGAYEGLDPSYWL